MVKNLRRRRTDFSAAGTGLHCRCLSCGYHWQIPFDLPIAYPLFICAQCTGADIHVVAPPDPDPSDGASCC